MKSATHALTAAALGLCLASCGGGMLGDNNGAGASGMIATGAAGRGSVSGVGGNAGQSVGVGGSIGNPCPPPPPPVCGGLCGNGLLEGCTTPSSSSCPGGSWLEECDGDDFGGDSCQQRGYGSGKLACNSDCTRGPDSCSPCMPPDALIASCGQAPPSPQQLGYYALAATDTEVALAVIEYGAGGAHSLLFQRLAPDLSLLGATAFPDLAQAVTGQSSIYGIAVAPLPSGGWTVASCAEPDVYIQTLDANGRLLGRIVVSRSVAGYACNGQAPVLAARPNGGPLMLWQDDSVVMSVIAADGLSASAPRTLVDATDFSGENPTAAWVGNEFAVAVPLPFDTTGTRALRLLRVAPDGTPNLVGDFLRGELNDFANIAGGPDARDVRVVYSGLFTGGDDAEFGMNWWRYDPAGPTRSMPIGSRGADLYRPASAVAFGDDTVVFTSRGYGQGFGLTRVASDGRVVSPYHEVFGIPYYGGAAAMVRRGPDVVVSVADGVNVYLARLTP